MIYYKKVHPKFKFKIHEGFYLIIEKWFVFGIDIQDDDEDDRWCVDIGSKSISIGLGRINPYFTWLRSGKK